MWNDFAEYIIGNYASSAKIVEVGVGNFLSVALTLRKHLPQDIILTDISPSTEGIVQDDIKHPNLKIYKGASLIYSIRPPEELHTALFNVVHEVGSDLIIKPYSEDSINTPKKMKLINYKKAIFYRWCTL